MHCYSAFFKLIIMTENIRKLKLLIEEYEEFCNKAEKMSDDWENGSECARAMNDPSDQYMIGMEIENKYNEIKEMLNAL